MGRRRFLAASAALLAAACAPRSAEPQPSPTSYVPPLGAYPAKGIWPQEYHRAAAPVREAYAYAAVNGPTLRFIPCYCGCEADGHTSNYSCYVRSRLPDGGLILDTHGFG